MEIEQALQAKHDLEISITSAVAHFQHAIGLTVSNLWLTQFDVTSAGDPRRRNVPAVTVEVKL